MQQPVIYCADIGSVATARFAWVRATVAGKAVEITCGRDIQRLAEEIARDLDGKAKVALGFECPLFVPISDDPRKLTSARDGEGDRPWSAAAGAGSLATGLTQVVWILRQIRSRLHIPTPAFVSWQEFAAAESGLFLWEAFISGGAHGADHAADAETAVRCFAAALPDLDGANAIRSVNVHSLIGAALLRTGWSDDLGLLARPCVVIKASSSS
jgi:hypothetical protein